LLDPDTYSVVDYREADRVLEEWESVTKDAERIYRALPENMRDAFFQLVLYPAKASAQVTELYIAVAKNHLYASQGRASANELAAQARKLFAADADLSAYYNHTLSNGKWDHMMDQTHIGYTFWNEPPVNAMPKVREVEIPAVPSLGVSVEGSALAWPGASGEAVLPEFDVFNQQSHDIDVFNRGQGTFDFAATASDPWIVVDPPHGTVTKDQHVSVTVDWRAAAVGSNVGSVKVTRVGEDPVSIKVSAFKPQAPTREHVNGFVESGGYVSIEAEHYTQKVDTDAAKWELIRDYGRTSSSMSVFPVTAPSVAPPAKSPCLEYQMYLFDSGSVAVEAVLAPTLNFVPGRGLRYAISFDEQSPQVIDALAQNALADWETSVKDSVRKVKSVHTLAQAGEHTLKFCMIDPGVVLQKLVVDLGGVKPSYLGPPESFHSALQH
jgi:hypothetical protein